MDEESRNRNNGLLLMRILIDEESRNEWIIADR